MIRNAATNVRKLTFIRPRFGRNVVGMAVEEICLKCGAAALALQASYKVMRAVWVRVKVRARVRVVGSTTGAHDSGFHQ